MVILLYKTMILFLVPYTCAAWPLTAREDTAGASLTYMLPSTTTNFINLVNTCMY